MEVVRVYRAEEKLLPEDQAVFDTVMESSRAKPWRFLVFSGSSILASAVARELSWNSYKSSIWNLNPTPTTTSLYGVDEGAVDMEID